MVIIAVILSYISLFAFGLADNIRGPLFSEILTDFGLNNSSGSWIFAFSSIMAFLSSLFVSKISKKISYQHLLQVSLLILSAGLLGFSWSKNLFQMLVAAVVFGISLGFLGVCQNALVVLGTTSKKRAQILSGLHAMYALSSFLAPTIVALLASRNANWRSSFVVASLFPLAVFLISLFMPRFKLHHQETHPPTTKTSHLSMKLQLLAGACFAMYVVAEIMVSSRMGLFFRREMQYSLEQSSLMVSYFFLLLFVARLLFTFVRFSLSLTWMLALCLLSSALFIAFGLWVEPWFLVIAGFTMGPFYGLSMAYLAEIFREKTSHAISVALAMQSFFVVAMHLGVGYLSDVLTIKKALWAGPVVLVISLFFLWRTHESQKN